VMQVPSASSGVLRGEALLEQGLAALEGYLAGLEVRACHGGASPPGGVSTVGRVADRLVTIVMPDGTHSPPVLVEAWEALTPAAVARLVLPRVDFVRRLRPEAAIVLISPWLSPRTRQLLEQHGLGYLDLTGNVLLQLARPYVRLRLDGARTDPWPRSRDQPRQLRGPKAGRLVRVLAEVTPSYTGVQLAQATQLSAAYVSRLLGSLEEQGLIVRRGRSVTAVAWDDLLRARADAAPLMTGKAVAGFVAPRGVDYVLDRLRSRPPSEAHLVVTGPLAASAVAPITVGGQLMLYVRSAPGRQAGQSLHEAGRLLGLLPEASGGEVLLLAAEDPVYLTRPRVVGGLPHVALAQLAVDCLGGTGRMPAEGEELLQAMARNTAQWQLDDILRWQLARA
jgi:hypothetical protein